MRYLPFIALIAVLISGCKLGDSHKTTDPPETASLFLRLTLQRPGGISMQKRSVLTGDSIHAIILDDDTIIDKTSKKAENGTTLQFSEVPPLKSLKIYSWIDDSEGNATHTLKDTIEMFLQPGTDSTIEDTLYSFRSGLEGVIAPLMTAIENIVITLNGDTVTDTAITAAMDSLVFQSDHLKASLEGVDNDIEIVISGTIWGNPDTILYHFDSTINIVSGESQNIQSILPFVGPNPVPAKMTLQIDLQAPGKTNMDFELEVPIPYKISASTGLYTEPGEDPNRGSPILTPEQIRSRLRPAAGYINTIRFYTSCNGHQHAPAIALDMGFKKVYGSCWIGKDESVNQTDIDSLVAVANRDVLYRAIVGNEVLLRGDQSVSALITYVNDVKARVSIPVGYSETSAYLLDPNTHPLIEACDFVAVNIHPYWEGIAIDRAMFHLNRTYTELQKICDDLGTDLVLGESGWRSHGPTRNKAVPSLANALQYNMELLTWKRQKDVPVLVFAIFDEPWKEPNDGGWGLWDVSRSLKPGYLNLFQGIDVADTWTDTVLIDGPGTPTLEFVQVPAKGSRENVVMRATHIRPANHILVAYIKVSGRWWIKPYKNDYQSLVYPDGLSEEIDVTTGGNDINASQIRVYLIDNDPPVYIPVCASCGNSPNISGTVAVADTIR